MVKRVEYLHEVAEEVYPFEVSEKRFWDFIELVTYKFGVVLTDDGDFRARFRRGEEFIGMLFRHNHIINPDIAVVMFRYKQEGEELVIERTAKAMYENELWGTIVKFFPELFPNNQKRYWNFRENMILRIGIGQLMKKEPIESICLMDSSMCNMVGEQGQHTLIGNWFSTLQEEGLVDWQRRYVPYPKYGRYYQGCHLTEKGIDLFHKIWEYIMNCPVTVDMEAPRQFDLKKAGLVTD